MSLFKYFCFAKPELISRLASLFSLSVRLLFSVLSRFFSLFGCHTNRASKKQGRNKDEKAKKRPEENLPVRQPFCGSAGEKVLRLRHFCLFVSESYFVFSMISRKESGFRDAPPIRAPSISG